MYRLYIHKNCMHDSLLVKKNRFNSEQLAISPNFNYDVYDRLSPEGSQIYRSRANNFDKRAIANL